MVTDFNRFSARSADRPPPPVADDDVSTATPKAGSTPVFTVHESTEITVRFEFSPKNADAAKKVALVHTHLLSKIKEVFDDDVTIFNNKNKVINTIDPIEWTPITHQSHFNLHAFTGTSNRKSKYFIIHRIRSTQSLSTIRTYNTIHSLLKEHSCFIREHHWDETVWDITQAGYLIGINPKHYTPDTANQIVSNLMTKKSPGKCPPLRMIHSSPRIQLDDRRISSQVYAIEYERKNAKEVIRKLQDAFGGTTQFLMAKLRYTHPNSFANALKMQNHTMRDTYVLPLLHITPSEHFYLQPILEQITGVTAVVPTRTTNQTGRYNILISSGQFKTTKAIIIKQFPAWYDAVPEDAKQNPESLNFLGLPGPKQGAEKDDDSSGAISFLTTSAASFASFDMSTTADAFETFTPATGTYSWSEVVQQKPPPVPSEVTTKPSSAATPTTASLATSAFTPNHTSDIQALREEYEEKQKSLREEYEEKQKNTTNEIAELKTMLQQVLITLHSLGAQGAVSSNSSTDPPSESEAQSTGDMDNMEVCIDETDQIITPKRDGSTVSLSGDAPGRHKRPDHKSSPKKTDFRKDE